MSRNPLRTYHGVDITAYQKDVIDALNRLGDRRPDVTADMLAEAMDRKTTARSVTRSLLALEDKDIVTADFTSTFWQLV